MTIQEFRYLLERFKNQNFADEEKAKLLELLTNSEENTKEQMLAELESMQMETEPADADFEIVLQRIKGYIHRDKRDFSKGKVLFMRLWRVAAIVVIAAITGGIVSRVFFTDHSISRVSEYEVRAPLGGRSEVTLPDGSKIWLNAGSTVRYNDGFNKQNRDLYLHGEGYFKVAKNRKIPFVVNARGIKVRAVGTEFNVKAYETDKTVETTLIEGVVTLEKESKKQNAPVQITLKPNQKAVFVKITGDLDIQEMEKITSPQDLKPVTIEKDLFLGQKIDPLPDIAWKENKLVFKGTEMESMAVTLERKYNIVIRFGSEKVKKIRFSGTLEDETLQQVLDVIKLTSPINYSISGKEVTIFSDEDARKEFMKHLKNK